MGRTLRPTSAEVVSHVLNRAKERRTLFKDEGGLRRLWGCDWEIGPHVGTDHLSDPERLCELKDLCWGGSEGEQSLIVGEECGIECQCRRNDQGIRQLEAISLSQIDGMGFHGAVQFHDGDVLQEGFDVSVFDRVRSGYASNSSSEIIERK